MKLLTSSAAWEVSRTMLVSKDVPTKSTSMNWGVPAIAWTGIPAHLNSSWLRSPRAARVSFPWSKASRMNPWTKQAGRPVPAEITSITDTDAIPGVDANPNSIAPSVPRRIVGKKAFARDL